MLSVSYLIPTADGAACKQLVQLCRKLRPSCLPNVGLHPE